MRTGRPPASKLGDRFGLLTIIGYEGEGKWLCQCDCGNKKIIRGSKLRSGNTRSCGCFRREFIRDRNKTHQETGSPLHRLWISMKNRCQNPNNVSYNYWGGRGISVCLEWSESYETFRDYILMELGDKPTPEHSLDRINNDGDYEPGNVRWATPSQQVNNRRSW